MSGLYSHLVDNIAAFAVIYGLFLSLGEVGPGNCLGMLAAKTGPTAVRGQFYGLAAAIGKVGAFVGTWGMCSRYVGDSTADIVFPSAFPPMIEGTSFVVSQVILVN